MTQTGTHTANAYGVNNVYAVTDDPAPPDAGWLIYAKDDGIGGIQIWMMTADGTATQLGGTGSGGLPTGLTYLTPDFSVGTNVDNQVVMSGSASGDPVTISAAGSDSTIALLLSGKGADNGVWITGLSDSNLVIDSLGNQDDILQNDAVPGNPQLILTNRNDHGNLGLLTYGANSGGTIIRSSVTRGTPGSPTPSLDADAVFVHEQYINLDTGSFSGTPVATYRSRLALDGMGNAGAHQTWIGYNSSGTDTNIIAYSADTGAGADSLAFRTANGTTLDLDASSVGLITASSLAVTDRTGSALTFACFTVDGKLIESAVACA